MVLERASSSSPSRGIPRVSTAATGTLHSLPPSLWTMRTLSSRSRSGVARVQEARHKLFSRIADNPWCILTFIAWNVGVMGNQMGFGILAFEMSRPQLQKLSQRMMIFPLSFPHAIALAAFCFKKYYVATGIFVGFYGNRLYYLVHGVQAFTSFRCMILLVVAIVRTAGVCFIGALLRRFICSETKKVPKIDGLWDAIWYFVVISITTLASEAIVALIECLGKMLSWKDFCLHWGTWWLGEVAAMVTISPCFIHGLSWKVESSTKLLEVIFICTAMFIMLLVVFMFNVRTYVRPLPYLIYPFLVHSAFRFNRRGWTLVLLVISTFCAWATIEGKGVLFSMSGGSLEPRLVLQLELFASVAAGVSIALTASVRETRALAKKFQKLNEGLETLVHRRTVQLTNANEELQASKRTADLANEAKSNFFTNVCHEIRTPIHGILGMSALMSETKLSESQQSSVTTITECADLLLQVMNSILDFAKVDSTYSELDMARFDINYTVTSTMHILEPGAKENSVQLRWEIDEAVPKYLFGDAGKLRQCLLNIVSNALKFTKGGTVQVSVSLEDQKTMETDEVLSKISTSNLEEVPKRVLKITETKSLLVPERVLEGPVNSPRPPKKSSQLKLLVQITDTGIGITREKLQTIFDRFVQADASISRIYGGTGLGLSIVQRSVELMGGHLLVSSEVGKGTTFYLFLPFYLEEVRTRPKVKVLKTPEIEEVRPPKEPSTSPSSPSFSILLAEDNAVNQKVATRLLEQCGHSVTVAGDGVQAVSAWKSNRSSFDLVLMDIQMPNMDGLEATRCIRDEELRTGRKRIPIIGVTAHAMSGYHDTCSSAGMDDYVAKPFEIKKLLGCIERVVKRRLLG